MELAVRAAAASCSSSSPSLHPHASPAALAADQTCRCGLAGWPSPRRPSPSISFRRSKQSRMMLQKLRRAIYRSGFKCSKCNKSFTSKDIFLDLTVTSGMKEYSELKPARTELLRSPLVSFLYFTRGDGVRTSIRVASLATTNRIATLSCQDNIQGSLPALGHTHL